MDDPRRKLFRLKLEIDEIESQMAKRAGEREEDITEFTSMSNELRARLERMGIDDDLKLDALLRGRQEDLSKVITRNVNKFASLDGDADDETREGEKGKIVYELYGSNVSTSSKEIMLEERLRHLEMAVGSGEGVSLFERVEEAMKLAKEVDAKEVEKVAAKAKVIR